jgi:hypothetical protein
VVVEFKMKSALFLCLDFSFPSVIFLFDLQFPNMPIGLTQNVVESELKTQLS